MTCPTCGTPAYDREARYCTACQTPLTEPSSRDAPPRHEEDSIPVHDRPGDAGGYLESPPVIPQASAESRSGNGGEGFASEPPPLPPTTEDPSQAMTDPGMTATGSHLTRDAGNQQVGWHQDSYDQNAWRWWDGQSWGPSTPSAPVTPPSAATHRRPKRALVLTVTVVTAAAITGFLVFSGSGADGAKTFTGRGYIDVSGPAYSPPYPGLPPLSGYTTDGQFCFANGPAASTTGPDNPIELGVIGKPSVEGQFYKGVPVGDVCRIKFEFDDVPAGAGDGNYLIRITGEAAMPTTEQELRDGVVLQLE